MIRCVAIDDEPIALDIIKEYCSRYGDIELACFSSPPEGMDYIESTRPDLVFLDIEMNSHNGLDLATKLPEGPVLIFTTAFAQYALEGFNVNAIDFLHKPIFYPRFTQAIEKAMNWIEVHGKKYSQSADTSGETIILKASHKNVIVSLDTVLYVEAMDNYVKVYRKGLPTVVSQITMKELEGLLTPDKFIRVHRSYIVSKGAIDRYTNRKIFLHDVEEPIPLGRTFYDKLISDLKK